MIEFSIHNDGRPDDLVDTREIIPLTVSMLERAGTIRDENRHGLADVAADTARAAVAVVLILAVGLTRPTRDRDRDRWPSGIADRIGGGAQNHLEARRHAGL